MRPHLKFLSGDYLTYQTKFDQTGQGNPLCKVCRTENETISHIISSCPAYEEKSSKILEELSGLCLLTKNEMNLQEIRSNPKILTQLILDPTSFNLEIVST